MELKSPIIGPVVGLVTTQSARVMAGIQHCAITHKANCGWIRCRKTSGEWGAAKQFRFNRNFYFTGVIELTGLDPNTCYEYQVGFEAQYHETPISESDASLWDNLPVYSFHTQACHSEEVGVESGAFHFCFGSCLRGSQDSRVGKVLKAVHQIHQTTPLNMMLWLGDQVYNDKLLALTLNNSSREDFSELYEEFFTNQYVQKVLPFMPNYMVMDDHEIEDSFKDGALDYADTRFNWLNRHKERLINGINAFYAYQASHGPIYDTQPSEQQGVAYVKGQALNQVPVKHYAEVNLGEVGLFLLDTRKERHADGLISDHQEAALKSFLLANYRVKLVASAVTFLADDDASPQDADNWKHAAAQRRRILAFIKQHQLENIVFLSGDIHSHFAASLLIDDQPSTIHQLVSGSLFWPTSFLIDKIRWFRDDVCFEKAIHGAPGFSLNAPVSSSNTDFFASNGVGYVKIQQNELLFYVLKPDGEAVIEASLPLA